MHSDSIPLPSASPGRDYIIDHIDTEQTSPDNFRGYGIFPGSRIRLLFSSPFSNPSAYEIMGTVIALRHEDSSNIFVMPMHC
ncbi:MAG: FeoA family protein [Lentihominibacter sp.]